MANMTGVEFYNYVLRTFIRTDKSTQVYEAVSDTIKDMRLRFGYEAYQVEGYTSGIDTLGEYAFGLPTNFGHLTTDVKVLDDDSSEVLIKLSKAEFDEKYPNPNYTDATQEKPEHYCIFSDQILLGPVPDSLDYEYEFSYSEEDTVAIDGDTTSVDFTDRGREIIKFGTLYRVYRDLGNDEEAKKWNALYEAGIVKFQDREKNNLNAPMNVKYRGI
jgi:hypothetical protein